MKVPLQIDLSAALSSTADDGTADEGCRLMAPAFELLSQDKYAGKTGFADVPTNTSARDDVCKLAEEITPLDFDAVLVIGIGGSSLGARAAAQALFGVMMRELPRGGRGFSFYVMDTIEPDTVDDILALAATRRLFCVVVSKSGTTLETRAGLDVLLQRMDAESVVRFVVVTDPGDNPLRAWAESENIESLPIPPNVGGRYSVMTPAALFPLAVLGADVSAMLEGAAEMEAACRSLVLAENPALRLASCLQSWMNKGISQFVFMPYSDRLGLLADWFAQLWAESLGKCVHHADKTIHNGSVLIKCLGPQDQHSQLQLFLDGPADKLVMFLSVQSFQTESVISGQHSFLQDLPELRGKSLSDLLQAEKWATREALRLKDRPSLDLQLEDISEKSLGAFFQLMMNTVAILGYHQGINPFDQPAVESIKQLTRDYLKRI